MNNIQSICVFCGSNSGRNPLYTRRAKDLGAFLAKNDITLVFGGSGIGLMGVIAQTVMDNSGYAVGVIPRRIHEMVSHIPLSEEHIVENMHQRKAMMYDLADAFIVMPGGLGTMEEFFEVFTWNQIGYHLKPIGILDVNNFFAPLINFLNHMALEGFCRKEQLDTLVVKEEPSLLIEHLKKIKLRQIPKHNFE